MGSSDRSFPASLLTDLVGYYSFNEASGTSVTDRSGNGKTGTLTNASIRGAGLVEGGLTFDGTNYCDLATTLNLYSLGDSHSVAAWVWVGSTTQTVQILNCNNRSSGSNASFNDGFSFRIIAGFPYARFQYNTINDPSTDARGNYTSTLQVAVGWNLVIFTRTATAGIFKLVNNAGSFTDSYAYSSNSVDFANGNTVNEIGKSGSNNSDSGTKVDEVGIWNRVITDAEINALWNAGNGRTKE